MSRLLRLPVLVLAAIALVAGCGGGDDAGAGGGGDGPDDRPVLHVYSGRHYDVEKAFEQFEDETGIDVQFLTGNDVELRERIAAEGEDTEADVYLTVDAGNLAAAAEDGLFQPLDSDVLREAIPEQYRDAEDRWFALALRARTIIYNTDELTADTAPKTYAELADPKWEGKVCLRNASNSYQQSLVASLIAQDGRDATLQVLEGWARNAEIYANDVELIKAMGAGACQVGVANHYYLAREIEEDPDLPVDLLWADQDGGGTHVNISGGGITKHAKNVELGRRFLEWLATDGQSILVDGNHEFPANPGVPAEPLITEEFGTDFVRQPLHATEIGRLNPEAIELMDEANFG